MAIRHVKVAVIGGGITGQLVQLAVPEAEIFDWQDERQAGRPLTRNFGANYLWEPLPGLIDTGVTFREFRVITHVDGQIPTLENVKRYKEKIGKSGDVLNWERQFTPDMPGYDFVSLPTPRVHYKHRVEWIDRTVKTLTFAGQSYIYYDFLVSTIPLYALLNMMKMREPYGRLQHKPIFFKITGRPPDAPYPSDILYVNYLSNPDIVPYRYCDRDGVRHFESIVPFDGTSTRRFTPGKIIEHPGVLEILEELASFNIFTFGRFGSWRPDELVHETYRRILDWKGYWDL